MARTVDPLKHAERRGVIVDAAARLIAARGYEAVTIADVLAEAGVSRGALYHYFAGKDELLVGVIERRINSWAVDIDAATKHLEDPVERLVALVRTLAGAKTQDLTLLVSAMPQLDAAGNAAIFLQLRSAAAERFLPLITAAVEEGVEAGAFHVASAESSSKVVLALLHEMSSCATRDLLAIAEGRSSRKVFHADLRAFGDAVPAVLGTRFEENALFSAEEADEWIDAVLTRYGTPS